MRRPFPTHQTNTITRANIEQALARQQAQATPEALAAHFCGVSDTGKSFAKGRHVERCARLMEGQEKSEKASA